MNRLLAKFHDTKIPMVEIFHSISGEGVSAGNLTTFVRAAGCDLRCTWCDTKYSFKETGHDVPMMQPQEIMNQVALFGCSEVICTGGEPLEIEKQSGICLPTFNNLVIVYVSKQVVEALCIQAKSCYFQSHRT